MYYPYFRGKQYELIAIRENAERMFQANIVPIIEPVKKNVAGLRRALEALVEQNVRFVLIVNPQCGDLCDINPALIIELANDTLRGYRNFSLGYIVNEGTLLHDVVTFCKAAPHPITIVHSGYQRGRELAKALNRLTNVVGHIFIEEYCSKLYRKHFKEKTRVLIRDGFIKRTNREHPEVEHFSDLHITYQEESVDGFGDFLIVGDAYSDGGGPAYAIAIHLTYIDADEDDDMFVKHYVSDRTRSPADPGGKFLEALQKLVEDVEKKNSKIYRSDAVNEYITCHKMEHYPGLGYVKKLSMQHHIELMLHFLGE
ncbi:MAG: sce7725 family protein [Desulfobulbia bacterium]